MTKAIVVQDVQKNEGGQAAAAISDGNGKSSILNMVLWSMVGGGIQFGWALQLSLLTPYVQTLGIPHKFSSLIWLCGPITGLLVQPCVGVWSDRCKSKWGRRRPFILSGALMVCLSVILIGYAADIGYLFGDTHLSCSAFKGSRPRAAAVFVLGFWLLDVANNAVQGPARALLADLAGPDQKYAANAIYSLWLAIGNIMGWLPFVMSKACCEACGDLKAAFFIAIVLVLFCTTMTLTFSHEVPFTSTHKIKQASLENPQLELVNTNPNSQQQHHHQHQHQQQQQQQQLQQQLQQQQQQQQTEKASSSVVIELWKAFKQQPASMRSVYLVTALSWLAWFPFFLYNTDWMGREIFHGRPEGSKSLTAPYHKGVQRGSFGLLMQSVVLVVSSISVAPVCRRLGSRTVWVMANIMLSLSMAAIVLLSSYATKEHHSSKDIKAGAVALFAILGVPLAVTFSVPIAMTATLTAEVGGGQGSAVGILNLSIVIPQMIIALSAGPWDSLFGGGNKPAFAAASFFALLASIAAAVWLPNRHSIETLQTTGH